MNKQSIAKIFAKFQAATPHPTTELIYHSPFELLISVILSAQATDKSVNKATERLFKIANTPTLMLKLGEKNLQSYIKTIGLYLTKSKHVIATCRILTQQFNGQVPKDRVALESLPGVGRKTANVILNTCFGEPVIAVDTHIFRVARRIGLAKGKTPLAVEKELIACIPKQYLHDAHHWLILHGRYTCTARKPGCPECIINNYCQYPDKTL